MSSLTELLLDSNELSSIPLSIGRLTELKVRFYILFVLYHLASLLLTVQASWYHIIVLVELSLQYAVTTIHE